MLFSLCAVLLFFGASNGIDINQVYEDLNSPSQFANRLQKLLNSSNENWFSPKCRAHLSLYIRSLFSRKEEDAWSKKSRLLKYCVTSQKTFEKRILHSPVLVFDAGAKIPTGLLEGNMADFGSFDECVNIEATFPSSERILGKYCIGVLSLSSPSSSSKQQLLVNNSLVDPERRDGILGSIFLQLATCLPNECSAEEVEKIYFLIGTKFFEQLCQTKLSRPELDSGAIATISVFGVILGIILISTAYDSYLQYLEKESLHPLLIAFSILTNGKKLLATNNTPSQISCLHGVRVITTMWVILGHRYSIQSSFPMRNLLEIADSINNKANMFIIEATISVDTFFFMSGLLISYSYMSAVTKGIKFNIIIYYVHRYLRLTPLFAALIVIHIYLVKYFGSGPLWPVTVQRDLIDGCKNNWWSALLYVQNWTEGSNCITQSWYLSIDMQLFVLSPILLIPMRRWPKYTLLATGLLTVCSVLTCFLTGWFYEFNHNMMGNNLPGQRWDFNKYYYTAIQTRAAPWLVGIIAGYVIFACMQRKTRLIINKALMIALWMTSLAVLCTCVFAGHDLVFGDYDRLGNSFHMGFVRPVWSVALGFIVFACVVGYGGPVNWFLSAPFFQVISRLTYALYLTHFAVIVIITAQMRVIPRVSNIHMMYVFWGDFVFTLAVSFVLTLTFESPLVAIEKVLLGGITRKKNKQPQIKESGRKSVETA